MTDNTGHEPYSFDFLETLTAISFPNGGYIVIDAKAVTQKTLPQVANCVTVAIALADGSKLVDHRESCAKQTIPARTIIDPIFMIWGNGVPAPTLANYQNIVVPNLDPKVQYGQQFAQVTSTFFGVTQVSTATHLPYLSGYFQTQSEAQFWAAAFSSVILHPQGYFTANGNLITAPFNGFHVERIDRPTIVPAQSVATFNGQYLVKVPKDAIVTGVHAAGGPLSSLTARGYHGSTPPSLSKVDPEISGPTHTKGYDTTDTTTTPDGTVTSVIASNFNTVTVPSGGTGGTG